MAKKQRRNPKRPNTTSKQSHTTTKLPEKSSSVGVTHNAPLQVNVPIQNASKSRIQKIFRGVGTFFIAVAEGISGQEYGNTARSRIGLGCGLIVALALLIFAGIAVIPVVDEYIPSIPTPLEGTPFAEDEVGVLLADFEDLDMGAREVERRIEREFEDAEIPFVRVHHTIADREQAQQIADIYNATITIWGESADAWIEVFYEITPRNEKQVETTIENIAVASDLENFSTFILEGMDSLYIVNFTVGQIHYFEEDYETALTFFNQTVGLIPEGREADVEGTALYFYRANAYIDLGDYERAIADFNHAIQLDVEYDIAYNNRGIAYLNLGDYERAIADFDHTIQLDSVSAAAYNNRGNAYADLGDYEQAIADFNHAIQLNAEVAFVYFNRGIIYLNLGDYERSIDDFTHAIQLDDKYAGAYVERGITYASLGDYEQAIDDFTHAIQLDISLVQAYYNRGITYASLGNYEQAVDDFTHAIQLDTEYADIYWGRGFAYYNLGNEYYEQAIADYQRYADIAGRLEPFMEAQIAEMQAALGDD
jgi:tetratricopeptide (TPR) repeat protein